MAKRADLFVLAFFFTYIYIVLVIFASPCLLGRILWTRSCVEYDWVKGTKQPDILLVISKSKLRFLFACMKCKNQYGWFGFWFMQIEVWPGRWLNRKSMYDNLAIYMYIYVV